MSIAKTDANMYHPVFATSAAPNLARSIISSIIAPKSDGMAHRNENLHVSFLSKPNSRQTVMTIPHLESPGRADKP